MELRPILIFVAKESMIMEAKDRNTTTVQFGMKWYNYFTKIRPWITFAVAMLMLLGAKDTILPLLNVNLVGATLLFFNVIYLFGILGYVIFQIVLFYKERKQSDDLLKIIEINLLYDFLIFIYTYVLEEYYKGTSFVVVALVVLVSTILIYFWYYKWNMEYFEKRLCSMQSNDQNKQKSLAQIVDESSVLKKVEAIPVNRVQTTPPRFLDEVGNYGIINASLANGFVENARRRIKQQIDSSIAECGLVRKTDLFKIIFLNISKEFETARGSKTDLVVSAYYQVAFDEIIARCGDVNNLLYSYSASKMKGAVSNDVHKYLQMIATIQLLIDDAIDSSKHCDMYREYSKQLQFKVLAELNAYIDDTTDWNKL